MFFPYSIIQDGLPILKWYFMSLRTNSIISRGKKCKKGGYSDLTFMEQKVPKSFSGSSELSFRAIELKLWNQPPIVPDGLSFFSIGGHKRFLGLLTSISTSFLMQNIYCDIQLLTSMTSVMSF